MHHFVMGTLAIAGGMAWFGGEWLNRSARGSSYGSTSKSALKIIWAVFVIAIGVQLLFYSES
jgi:hypothetical protein